MSGIPSVAKNPGPTLLMLMFMFSSCFAVYPSTRIVACQPLPLSGAIELIETDRTPDSAASRSCAFL